MYKARKFWQVLKGEEGYEVKIQDCPIEQRPYEKFEKYGAEALTDTELLAILLRSGTASMNVIELSTTLLTYFQEAAIGKKIPSLVTLYHFSYEELCKIKGVGKVKALQILALCALCKRMVQARYIIGEKINSPQMIANFFMEELRHSREEYFVVVFLDAKCRMIGNRKVSIGSLTVSIVHPREVYKWAISKSAHSIIVLHNHPSGDPSPSQEDLKITTRLKQVGELIGIPLLDHIIIGDGIYRSLKEESYL